MEAAKNYIYEQGTMITTLTKTSWKPTCNAELKLLPTNGSITVVVSLLEPLFHLIKIVRRKIHKIKKNDYQPWAKNKKKSLYYLIHAETVLDQLASLLRLLKKNTLLFVVVKGCDRSFFSFIWKINIRNGKNDIYYQKGGSRVPLGLFQSFLVQNH